MPALAPVKFNPVAETLERKSASDVKKDTFSLNVISIEVVALAMAEVNVGAELSTVNVEPLVGADVIKFPAPSVPVLKAMVDVPSPAPTV
jgi:hypothetical protein